MNLFSQNDPIIDETIEYFLNSIFVTKSKRTYEIYKDILVEKLTLTKGLKFRCIDEKTAQIEIVRCFEAFLINMKCAPSTKNIYSSCLNSYMKYVCSRWKFLCHKRFTHAKKGKSLPKDIDKNHLINTIHALNKNRKTWLDYRNHALIVFLYSTGLRVSEAISIRRSEFNHKQNTIVIYSSKTYSERSVFFPDSTLVHVSEYVERIPFKHRPKYLWMNKKGEQLSREAASVMIKKLVGSPPHHLRHSYATHMYEAGCDLSVLSELLGHSSINNTLIYTNIRKKSLKECVDNHHPMRSFRL